MITCETSGMMWTVEGKIEALPGSYGGEGAHPGIDDLSELLAKHVGRWAKVRVELIEGPSGIGESKFAAELKRMRSLATEIRELLTLLRSTRGPGDATVEETCVEKLAETMLFVCEQLEAFDRRLQSLESGRNAQG